MGIHTSRRKGYIFYRWVNRHIYSEVVNVGCCGYQFTCFWYSLSAFMILLYLINRIESDIVCILSIKFPSA